MYVNGDLKCGSIPPIGALAPAIPPAALRHDGLGQSGLGNVNPNGGLVPLPCAKIGAGDPERSKVGRMPPGGLPRNSSCTLAWDSQFEYMPKPPLRTVVPFPATSHAMPARGM